MAPTKKDGEKEAKLTPEQSATLILDYLRKTNRPYSATDISSNLKNRVTKAAAQKLLKDLHERKEIEGRASGKQLVYHALQEEPDADQVEQLAATDAETTRLREDTLALKYEEKELRQRLKEDTVQIPLPQLKANIASMETEKQEMEARLQKLKRGSLKPVSAEEKELVNRNLKKVKKSADARRKIRLEVWKEIAGAVGKDKAGELMESLDLQF